MPYDRSLYEHWIDHDTDCQDTRQEVLIAESMSPVELDPAGCKVVRGKWFDPYTGQIVTDPSGLDVDHIIPLAEAHRSGGQDWDAERRRAFANNLSNANGLIAVSASANRSKGDSDPADWLPPNQSYRCEYIRNWILYKFIWALSMDEEEETAIRKLLKDCATGGAPGAVAAVGQPGGAAGTVAAAGQPAPGSAGGQPGPGGCIDINTADSGTLQIITGVGPARAKSILDYISTNGPFATLDEVDNVSGVGPATMANVRSAGFCVAEETAPKEATPSPDDEAAESPSPGRRASRRCKDINRAGSSALQRITGIGASKAAAILEFRERFGPFNSIEEVTRVSGIGPSTLRNVLQAGFCVP